MTCFCGQPDCPYAPSVDAASAAPAVRQCPICLDTYADLWGHLASLTNHKRCGEQLIECGMLFAHKLP